MNERTYEEYHQPAAVRDRLAAGLAAAEKSVLLMTNVTDAPAILPTLQEIHDREVLVLLLVTGTSEADLAPETDLSTVATVARFWDVSEIPMTLAAVDDEWGLSAAMTLNDETGSGRAVAFSDVLLRNLAVATVLGNLWADGRQLATGSPAPLPHAYESFYHAVVDATFHLSAGTAIAASVEGFPVGASDDRVTLDGQVVTVRQGLVSPMTAAMPAQNSLVVATDDGERVTVGGTGAIMEDFEATRVELHATDDDAGSIEPDA